MTISDYSVVSNNIWIWVCDNCALSPIPIHFGKTRHNCDTYSAHVVTLQHWKSLRLIKQRYLDLQTVEVVIHIICHWVLQFFTMIWSQIYTNGRSFGSLLKHTFISAITHNIGYKTVDLFNIRHGEFWDLEVCHTKLKILLSLLHINIITISRNSFRN